MTTNPRSPTYKNKNLKSIELISVDSVLFLNSSASQYYPTLLLHNFFMLLKTKKIFKTL